ncbi:MAG: tRNA pseudouridine(38-40) synthase TruA [Phycisphaerae bacterium]|nr:tRNA pseudouridine(38-40) synthase TruA [Phycisphaerae bacterium]
MAFRRIKLEIHYDGTVYHGWQRQPQQLTIQETLEAALERLCGQKIEVIGSSRTDAGVHALGQVAHFDFDSPIPTNRIAKALNRLLPDNIAIAEAVEVGSDFDAVASTKRKWYRYTICTAPIRPVMEIRYCWHRPGHLDAAAMQAAAARLIGTFDFKSFASAADQRQRSIRTVCRCSVTDSKPHIVIDIEADGFLYNMVRNIVGTLVEIGRGRWRPESMEHILAAKDRNAAGPIAPAAGLCLMKIYY